MLERKDITVGNIQVMRDRLRDRHEIEHNRMDVVEAWRTLDEEQLRDRIWRGVTVGDQGKYTIVKPTLAAVNDTTIAQKVSNSPTIKVRMKDSLTTSSADEANMVERVFRAILWMLNHDRDVSIDEEVIDHAYTRGALVIKVVALGIDERGEVRLPATPENTIGQEDQVIAGPNGFTVIDEEGEFPIYVEVMDPRDCYYQLCANRRDVSYMIHNYWADWLDIVEAFPGIEDDEKFKGYTAPTSRNTSIEVIDYWDKKHHAITIGGLMYGEVEEHPYPRCPFVVRRIREQSIRNQVREDSSGATGRTGSRDQRAVTPFTWQMVGSMEFYSMGESLLASYLPEMANSPIVHEGVNSEGRSPYFKKIIGRDGKITPVPVYTFQGNKTAGGRAVWPAFDSERFRPLAPTPIADHLQAFVAGRENDVAITSYSQGMLTGQLRSDPSGYSVQQQRQMTSSKALPYDKGSDSGLSSMLSMIGEWIQIFWDRGEIAIKIPDMVAGETIELTPALLENVQEVTYEINPMVPATGEQEVQMILAVHARGLMSDYDAIELLNMVEDDTTRQIGRIALDVISKQDPRFLQAKAAQFAKDEGMAYFDPQTNQQVLAGQEPQQPAPQGGPPPDPAMLQQLLATIGQGASQGPPVAPSPNGAAPVGPEPVPEGVG